MDSVIEQNIAVVVNDQGINAGEPIVGRGTPPHGVRMGERIRALREQRGWTQTELGQRVGETGHTRPVGQGHIANLEKGGASPSVELLAGLATALGTTADYLLGLAENPTPADPDTVILSLPDEHARSVLREGVDLLLALSNAEQLNLIGLLRSITRRFGGEGSL